MYILTVISYMQVRTVPLSAYMILLSITLGIVFISAYVHAAMHYAHIHHVKGAKRHKASTKPHINWQKIRHLWLE